MCQIALEQGYIRTGQKPQDLLENKIMEQSNYKFKPEIVNIIKAEDLSSSSTWCYLKTNKKKL